MKRLFTLFLASFIFSANQLIAQKEVKSSASPDSATNSDYLFNYYIYISGITCKEDVATLESNIPKKAGVTYFLGNRYPVRYFLLKSKNNITLETFQSWISPKLTVEYYEEGEYEKEGAILIYNKHYPSKK